MVALPRFRKDREAILQAKLEKLKLIRAKEEKLAKLRSKIAAEDKRIRAANPYKRRFDPDALKRLGKAAKKVSFRASEYSNKINKELKEVL